MAVARPNPPIGAMDGEFRLSVARDLPPPINCLLLHLMNQRCALATLWPDCPPITMRRDVLVASRHGFRVLGGQVKSVRPKHSCNKMGMF